MHMLVSINMSYVYTRFHNFRNLLCNLCSHFIIINRATIYALHKLYIIINKNTFFCYKTRNFTRITYRGDSSHQSYVNTYTQLWIFLCHIYCFIKSSTTCQYRCACNSTFSMPYNDTFIYS